MSKPYCGFFPPPWSPDRWVWSNTAASLAVCQRYAQLNPEQQLLHDVQALTAGSQLRRLMPAATKARLADEAFCEAAEKLREAT